MCEVAAHLTDHVLPHFPARQWVLSVPKRLRPYLHHDVYVAGGVLQILLRAIRTTLRRSSPGAPPRAQLGAVSFFHRFGSSLNVHPQELSRDYQRIVNRAQRPERFLTQPFHVTERFTRLSGAMVPLRPTIEGCERILADEFADRPEKKALNMIGAIEEGA